MAPAGRAGRQPGEREMAEQRSGRWTRRAIVGATASGMLAIRSGVASAQPSTTLVVALGSSPTDLDPQSAFEERSALIVGALYEPLIRYAGASTDQFEGVLAESWSSNPDQSVWTFRLRQGIRFEDGSPCDAAAVKASFVRLFTLGLGPATELARFLTSAEQIATPDERTVVFNLGRPQPSFEQCVGAGYGAAICNAAALRIHDVDGDWGHEWAVTNAGGAGTGRYRLLEYLPEDRTVLERNASYWRGWEDDQFERVIVRVVPEESSRRQLLESGGADIVDTLTPEAIEQLRTLPTLVVDSNPTTGVWYVIMTVDGPLASPVARRALCHAFPIDEVREGVYGPTLGPTTGGVAPVTNGYDPSTPVLSYDPELARSLLAEADVAEGTVLSGMVSADNESSVVTMQLLQAALAEVGIELEIEQVAGSTVTDILFRDADPAEQPDLILTNWWPAYNDAWNHLQPQILCSAARGGGANAGGYCSPEVDKLMNRARDAVDRAEYLTAIGEVQRIIANEDPPAIYFGQVMWTTVRQASVEGFGANPVYIGVYDFWSLRRAAGSGS
jgi:peptide/nickel transport system substrate-binding protein